MKLTVRPLSEATWPDLETVFNARGCSVARGCWCMYYRRSGEPPLLRAGTTRSQENRAELKALMKAGKPIGLIGYRGKEPVGWVSFAPREDYVKLAKSPVLKPVDEEPVWSIICFVVPSEFRGQGVATALLDAVVAFAKKTKLPLLEAYPVDRATRSGDDTMWFGSKSMFDEAGFEEVARRKPERPIVRLNPA